MGHLQSTHSSASSPAISEEQGLRQPPGIVDQRNGLAHLPRPRCRRPHRVCTRHVKMTYFAHDTHGCPEVYIQIGPWSSSHHPYGSLVVISSSVTRRKGPNRNVRYPCFPIQPKGRF